jgi:tripartite-type tricarboxylate transporter receptor subunit TctC
MPLAAFAAAEPSASYPSRPIRLVVPQNPGGGTDAGAGSSEPGTATGADFGAMLKAEVAKWAKVVQQIGLKPD